MEKPMESMEERKRVKSFYLTEARASRMRDRFAMAALTGILSDPETKIGQPVAEYAYKMADLMLEERDKK